jgi:hypothetical protein
MCAGQQQNSSVHSNVLLLMLKAGCWGWMCCLWGDRDEWECALPSQRQQVGLCTPNMVPGGQYSLFAAHLTILCECIMLIGLLLCTGLLAENHTGLSPCWQLLMLTQPSTPHLSSPQLTIAVFQLLELREMQQAQMGMPGSDQLPSCEVTTGAPERQSHKGRVSIHAG